MTACNSIWQVSTLVIINVCRRLLLNYLKCLDNASRKCVSHFLLQPAMKSRVVLGGLPGMSLVFGGVWPQYWAVERRIAQTFGCPTLKTHPGRFVLYQRGAHCLGARLACLSDGHWQVEYRHSLLRSRAMPLGRLGFHFTTLFLGY